MENEAKIHFDRAADKLRVTSLKRNIYNTQVEKKKDIVADQEELRQFEALDKIYKGHKDLEKHLEKHQKDQDKKLKFKIEKQEPKYEKLEQFKKNLQDDLLEKPKE